MKCTFPLALTFLTKFPWVRTAPAEEQALARSMFWFPWVGALLGVVFWGVWAGLQRVLPAPAAAGVLLGLTVLSTGGLHLDGLADTADGLAGGRNPEERLRIMKDSRVGTFGVLSLVVVLVLKFSFFLGLAQQLTQGAQGAAAGLILFPVVSRWGMVLLAHLSPYARPEGGLGQAMTSGVSAQVLAGATVSTLVVAFATLGLKGVVLLAAAGIAVWLGSLYFGKKLGGVTGDVLGAANEALEVLVLAGVLLLR